ncbi:hypothetical protein GCM10010176_075460 [Nonomuraea spiralis]|nr:hypothetical protein GCM10010176_075460 [Nonomuraea spiralis]
MLARNPDHAGHPDIRRCGTRTGTVGGVVDGTATESGPGGGVVDEASSQWKPLYGGSAAVTSGPFHGVAPVPWVSLVDASPDVTSGSWWIRIRLRRGRPMRR